MSAASGPALLVWAAALCACLAALALHQQQDDSRRRARRLLRERDARPGPWSTAGPGGPAPSGRVAAALAWVREAVGHVLAALSRRPARGGDQDARWAGRGQLGASDRRTGPVGRGSDVRGAGSRGAGWRKGAAARSGAAGPQDGASGPGWSPGGGFGWRLGAEVLCLPAGALLGMATGSVLPVLAGGVAVPLAGRFLRGREARAAEERGVAAVSALCGTVAGDLRAGRPPHAALSDAVESAGWPDVPELAGASRLLLSAARFGGDVPRALREASRCHPGARGLAAVAACWQVAVDGGAGLAAALDRVAAALRAEADQRDDLRAQLAGPRSTAVLLALLPLFGVVLGAGLGADASAVLLHTPTGLLCLLVGGLLEWAGLAWTAKIIRSAQDGPGGRVARVVRGRRTEHPRRPAPGDLSAYGPAESGDRADRSTAVGRGRP